MKTPNMKTRQPHLNTSRLLLAIAPVLLAASLAGAAPMGTSFTYEGRLTDNGSPVDGLYDFSFSLYDAAVLGNDLTGASSQAGVPVSNGVFSVTLDFGAGMFNGDARFLEIGVRPDGSVDSYTLLAPRQELMATPYALYASNAESAGNVPGGSIGTAQLADGAVGSAQIADGSLTTADLGPDIGVWEREEPFITHAGPVKMGNRMTIGRSGVHYDEIAYNTVFTETDNAYNYLVRDSASSIRLGWDGSGIGGMEFRTAPRGEAGDPLTLVTRMVLTEEGSVGIGTTQVGKPLEVVGNVVTRRSAAAGATAVALAAEDDGLGSLWTNDAYDPTSPTSGWKRTIYMKDGNVGIGTASPLAKLDVDGTGRFSNPGDGNVVLELGTERAWVFRQFGSGSSTALELTSANPANNNKNFILTTTGRVGIGTTSPQATLDVNGTTITKVLTITGGADVAEPFEMSTPNLPKGSVVIIDETNPGRLKLSERACDTRVAGIVSGANGVNPGITLRQEGVMEGAEYVALSGRVYTLADASETPIKPGDLLTTSDIPGHAMRVTDTRAAQGAIIGKAMTGLAEGRGLVLVSLQ